MACFHCGQGDVPTLKDGVKVHYVKTGFVVQKFYCEDPVKQEDTPPISDDARTQLYLMVDIAYDIRMKHDIKLYDSLDWTRELFKEGFRGSKEKAIELLLLRHHHVCTPACRAPKVIE